MMLVSIVPANAAAISWEDFLNSVMTQSQGGTAFPTASNGNIAAGNTVGTYGQTRATGETTYVLAGSDFQPKDYSTITGVNLLNQILNPIYNAGYTAFDGFLFAGDYDYGYTSSTAGKNALQVAIKEKYPYITHEVYVEGNHDSDSRQDADLVANGTLSSSGANDDPSGRYGVFVIHERDYMWYNDDKSTIEKTAANLEAYLNVKQNAGYTKPIFVISHLPLNYSMRTKNDGDGQHANYIFDVLNKAGNAGLNIIFLFGHDHSNGWDDYLGGSAIYLEKGDKINIAQNSKTTFKEETLAFTYMNAGYVSYYTGVNTGSETDLTMTVFEITDDDVTVKRYSADGLHDLKSKGVTNSYKNESGYAPNTEVYKSPQTITLNKTITPAGGEVTPPEIPDVGGGTTTGRTYTRVTSTSELVSGGKYLIFYNGSHFMLPEVVEKSDGSVRKGFNIESTSVCGPDTISGDYTAKEWTLTSSGSGWLLGNGTQYAKLTNTSNYKVTATLENSGDVFTIGGRENAFTFSNGTYVFNYNDRGLINGYANTAAKFYIYRMTSAGGGYGTFDGSWITITKPTEGTPAVPEKTTFKYVLDTNGVNAGTTKYLIVNTSANGPAYVLTNNNGTVGSTPVTISNKEIIIEDETNVAWVFSNSTRGNVSNQGRYISPGDSSLSLSNTSTTLNIANRTNGAYRIYRNSNRPYYYLRYNNGNWTSNSANNTNSIGTVYLFAYDSRITTPGTPAVPGIDGLFAKINGKLSYDVANGTSAAGALAAVKAGITGYMYQGSAEPGDNVTVTALDDNALTWTLDPSYGDGTTAGEYTVTIAYKGVTLGTAMVKVPAVAIAGYGITSLSASVRQGTAQTVSTGAEIVVTLANGNFYTVPVTVSMLSKNGQPVSTTEPGPITGLTVTYNGVKITENFTLNVTERVQNNYPEYPDEGAVKVSKTATGIDFQASGIAQVEVSASGVPAQKGADVVVVIDTSSSMKDNEVPGTNDKRIKVLSDSLKQMLTQFQTPGDNELPPDISIAIIDFNGYFNGDAEAFDKLAISKYRSSDDRARVFTGTTTGYINDVKDANGLAENVGLSAANFVSAGTLDPTTVAGMFNADNCSSGTNYDGALENAYKLLSDKQAANGDEERDAYVIFLSDGAPFRYNGLNCGNGSEGVNYTTWNTWLNGTWAGTHTYSHLRNIKDGYHFHRYAEAIKGDPSQLYAVVDRNSASADPAYLKNVSGLGATIYGIGFGLSDDTGANGSAVTMETQHELIRVISSDNGAEKGKYSYPNVQSPDALTNAFTQIATEINYAANNARFVDQMGESFNLRMTPSTYSVKEGGVTQQKTLNPCIEILSYGIYTKGDAGNIPAGKNIGDRNGTKTLLEVVKFDASGHAYSNLIDVNGNGTCGVTVNADGTYTISDTGDNILGTDGVIHATNFFYNTNTTPVTVEGVAYPQTKLPNGTTTNNSEVLPAETFYWKMGTVQTTELAMRYYVYLDGSMEGTRAAGSYATNEFATLYYDNHLGNPCYKDTVSPTMAWESANVSYAFYLVNDKGEIIVNQTNGLTGTFANKIDVTKPVEYGEILLNDDAENIRALDVRASSDDVLPKYYQLYDESASYTISIKSNGSGYWTIEKGADKVASTYVTRYDIEDPSAYSNALRDGVDGIGNLVVTGHDYTQTVVWFAVVWKAQAHPDTVVIDYGLPVDIAVLSNDMFGENGKLAAIGEEDRLPGGYDTATVGQPDLAAGFGDTYESDYGIAVANRDTGKVRYAPKSMQMGDYDKFAYAVYYSGANSGYYYDIITVIPATTIYYEEKFVTFTDGSLVNVGTDGKMAGTAERTEALKKYGIWERVVDENVDVNNNATQEEDRPGRYSLSDADNFYGYDGVNKEIKTYSLGAAMQVTVGNHEKKDDGSYKTTGYNGYAPKATFTFTGTGFDIISLTDSDSGMITVTVKDAANAVVDRMMITNYYGMKYEDGKWTSSAPAENQTEAQAEAQENVPNTIWQVPVIKKAGLTYGTYTVEIQVNYMTLFDQDNAGVGNNEYYFVLDAIRIYDPAGDVYSDDKDPTIKDAYIADGEGYPHYLMVKEAILGRTDLENLSPDMAGTLNGAVFVDGKGKTDQVADYSNPGPNNEAYLAPSQSISFKLTANTEPVDVQLGVKLAYGTKAEVKLIYTVDKTQSPAVSRTFETATDMYYTIKQHLSDADPNTARWTTGTITILNDSAADSNNIISLTNIKATFASPTTPVPGTDEDALAPASTGYSLFSAGVDVPAVARTLGAAPVMAAQEEEPVSIAFLTDAETVQNACAVMTSIYAPKPAVFVPEAFEYIETPLFFGLSAINVIASQDVAEVTVNGLTAQKLYDMRTVKNILSMRSDLEARYSEKISANAYWVWTVTTRSADSYDIVAYNAENLASASIGAGTVFGLSKANAADPVAAFRVPNIMSENAQQTFAPKQFKSYISEEMNGTKKIITHTSEDVAYVMINGEIVNRYITETFVDLGNYGMETSKRVWIAEAGKSVKSGEIMVNAYNKYGKGAQAQKAELKNAISDFKNLISPDQAVISPNIGNIGNIGNIDSNKNRFGK